jgi:hypothetical protein
MVGEGLRDSLDFRNLTIDMAGTKQYRLYILNSEWIDVARANYDGLAGIVDPSSFYLKRDCLERGHLPLALLLCKSCLSCTSPFVIAGDKAFVSVEFSVKCRST